MRFKQFSMMVGLLALCVFIGVSGAMATDMKTDKDSSMMEDKNESMMDKMKMGEKDAMGMESVEGTIQGFNCVSKGMTCPMDKIDAHVASEKAFVILKEGGGHYLIGNLDRAILGRHVTEMVRINGHVDHHVGAIFADSLETKKGDKWKKVWTLEWEQNEMYRTP